MEQQPTSLNSPLVHSGKTTGLAREQIEKTVRALMREHLGVKEFDWNDQFVRDLNVD